MQSTAAFRAAFADGLARLLARGEGLGGYILVLANAVYPLPLSSPHWAHNGGGAPYPAHCLGFDDPIEAWAAIDRLHVRAVPYNLLYLPGCMYLLARRPQGSYAQPDWSTGHAWYEMAGGVVTFSRDAYERLQAEAIETELRRVTLT